MAVRLYASRGRCCGQVGPLRWEAENATRSQRWQETSSRNKWSCPRVYSRDDLSILGMERSYPARSRITPALSGIFGPEDNAIHAQVTLDADGVLRPNGNSVPSQQIREIYREGPFDCSVALLYGQTVRISKAGRQKLAEIGKVAGRPPSDLVFHPLSVTGAWLQNCKVSSHIQEDSQHHLRDCNLQGTTIRI
jgi:hypothetical protein